MFYGLITKNAATILLALLFGLLNSALKAAKLATQLVRLLTR